IFLRVLASLASCLYCGPLSQNDSLTVPRSLVTANTPQSARAFSPSAMTRWSGVVEVVAAARFWPGRPSTVSQARGKAATTHTPTRSQGRGAAERREARSHSRSLSSKWSNWSDTLRHLRLRLQSDVHVVGLTTWPGGSHGRRGRAQSPSRRYGPGPAA